MVGQNNRSVKTLTQETAGGGPSSRCSPPWCQLRPSFTNQRSPFLVFDLLGHGVVDCENFLKHGSLWGSPNHFCQEIGEIRSELKTAKKDMELRQNEFFGLDGVVGERDTFGNITKSILVGKVQV